MPRLLRQIANRLRSRRVFGRYLRRNMTHRNTSMRTTSAQRKGEASRNIGALLYA